MGMGVEEDDSPPGTERTMNRKEYIGEKLNQNKVVRRVETIKAILKDLVHGIEETPKFDIANASSPGGPSRRSLAPLVQQQRSRSHRQSLNDFMHVQFQKSTLIEPVTTHHPIKLVVEYFGKQLIACY